MTWVGFEVGYTKQSPALRSYTEDAQNLHTGWLTASGGGGSLAGTLVLLEVKDLLAVGNGMKTTPWAHVHTPANQCRWPPDTSHENQVPLNPDPAPIELGTQLPPTSAGSGPNLVLSWVKSSTPAQGTQVLSWARAPHADAGEESQPLPGCLRPSHWAQAPLLNILTSSTDLWPRLFQQVFKNPLNLSQD